jgi:hypothetical protein
LKEDTAETIEEPREEESVAASPIQLRLPEEALATEDGPICPELPPTTDDPGACTLGTTEKNAKKKKRKGAMIFNHAIE